MNAYESDVARLIALGEAYHGRALLACEVAFVTELARTSLPWVPRPGVADPDEECRA